MCSSDLQAIGLLFDLAREINAYSSRASQPARPVLDAAHDLFQEYGREILGILRDTSAGESDLTAPLVDLILAVRSELRASRLFALADRIREGLEQLGIVVEDTPRGPRWKIEGASSDTEF